MLRIPAERLRAVRDDFCRVAGRMGFFDFGESLSIDAVSEILEFVAPSKSASLRMRRTSLAALAEIAFGHRLPAAWLEFSITNALAGRAELFAG